MSRNSAFVSIACLHSPSHDSMDTLSTRVPPCSARTFKTILDHSIRASSQWHNGQLDFHASRGASSFFSFFFMSVTMDAFGTAEESTSSSRMVVNSTLALGTADRPTRPSPMGAAAAAAAWLPGAFAKFANKQTPC